MTSATSRALLPLPTRRARPSATFVEKSPNSFCLDAATSISGRSPESPSSFRASSRACRTMRAIRSSIIGGDGSP